MESNAKTAVELMAIRGLYLVISLTMKAKPAAVFRGRTFFKGSGFGGESPEIR